VQVVNSDDVDITGNVIADNTATLPVGVPNLTNPAGGLTLFSLPAFNVGPGESAGPVEDVRVSGNYFGDNRALVPAGPPSAGLLTLQMDVFVGDPSIPPLLAAGEGLEFRDNRCDASLPLDVCGAPPYPVG
jgi:hypothetical protein